MTFQLYNTLTRERGEFHPIDKDNIRMYVCGPTVYDYAHIGNARPMIVFDLLYRLLRHEYGSDHVTYVRNITDVDDKIIDRANEEGISIGDLTARTIAQFEGDMTALNCLAPTIQPRATEHIPHMIEMISALIEKGHAYEAEGHVLFHVPSMKAYGKLSNRSVEEMQAGARVEVAPFKRDPMDFVLWKPAKQGEQGFGSPFGLGRPGWHIECSAMSKTHLGEVFDIHGGGVDLVFPHHENEIAQSCSAHGTDKMAQVWMHNGFLQVEGEKMSKSLGNFITIHDLLESETFGGRAWPGPVIRLAMLMTHYRKPIDWTVESLKMAFSIMTGWQEMILGSGLTFQEHDREHHQSLLPSETFLGSLRSDLNFPGARAELDALAKQGGIEAGQELYASLRLAGLTSFEEMRHFEHYNEPTIGSSDPEIDKWIMLRKTAKQEKNWQEADRIRDELDKRGIVLKDTPDGNTTWDYKK